MFYVKTSSQQGKNPSDAGKEKGKHEPTRLRDYETTGYRADDTLNR